MTKSHFDCFINGELRELLESSGSYTLSSLGESVAAMETEFKSIRKVLSCLNIDVTSIVETSQNAFPLLST